MAASTDSSEELNLIPYLDIMVNLVIFLLFSFKVVLELVQIELMAPAYGASTASASDNQNKQPLTVVVTRKGFTVLSTDPTVEGRMDIPVRSNGDYDTDKLHNKLVEYRDTLGLGTNVIITADMDVPYKTIVLTMDAARENEGEPLFPDVMLARSIAPGAQ